MARDTKAKYMLIWFCVTSALYFLVQIAVSHSYSFMTPLDNLIPFVPEFIWVYHTLIPVIVITTIFSMERRQVFFNTILALSISVVILTVCHILFPSFYPRQEISTSSISLWLVSVTRAVDAACNTFPSGHVAFSWVLYFCIGDAERIKRTKWLRATYLLWAILITLSTLALKQHYMFDVAAGFALAMASVAAAKKIRSQVFLCEQKHSKIPGGKIAET